MAVNENIEHKGVVVDIQGQMVCVQITNQSACAACHAKGACSSSDLQDKIIEVATPRANTFQIGQIVNIGEKNTQGFKAVLYAYVLPAILILSFLISSKYYITNELITGVTALVLVALYFFVLYFFRSKLKNSFSFTINHPF